MKFDRMGRRVEYVETVADPVESTAVTNKHQKFVYDGYLCVQRLNGTNNAITDLFEWDPTEPVATRPLFWQARTPEGNYSLFYTHDGNKNVSEAVFYQRARGVAAHYEYAPFGEIVVQTRGNAWGSFDLSSLNPWRFSSEYADDTLGIMYYNYRHYEPMMGRWLSRDRISDFCPYLFLLNSTDYFDYLGDSVSKQDWMKKEKLQDVIEIKKTTNAKVIVRPPGVSGLSLNDAYGQVLLEPSPKFDVECRCGTVSQWRLVVHFILSLKIEYVKEGARVTANGRTRRRTKEGVARTISHEEEHAAHFEEAFNAILGDVLNRRTEQGDYVSREKCKELESTIKADLKSGGRLRLEWEATRKNEESHRGEKWKKWYEKNGSPMP